MDGQTKLLIACGVLGGIVLILAAIYAYIYYTQIRPTQHRARHHSDRYTPVHQGSGDADDRKLRHAFMIFSYTHRAKSDAV